MTKILVDSELLERLHSILNCGAADEDIIVDTADELRAALVAPQQEGLQLLDECRSSVKFDLNRYERMALDFKRLGAEGKRTYDMADAEATRLHALLEKIDATLSAAPKLPTTDDRKDAERYKWLRDIGDRTWEPMAKRVPEGAKGIDAAIDAAIAAQKGEKE